MSPEALLQRGEQLDGFGIGARDAQVPDDHCTAEGAGKPWHFTPNQIAATLFRVECRLEYTGIGPYPDMIMDRLLK